MLERLVDGHRDAALEGAFEGRSSARCGQPALPVPPRCSDPKRPALVPGA